MVAIFHLPLLRVAREANVVVGGEQQACPFAFEPLLDRFDFTRLGFLFRDEVVQTKDHQCVRVGQHSFVNGEFVTSLIDTLEHCDGMSGRLPDDLLK